MKKVKKVLVVSGDTHLKDVLYFCLDGWGYEVFLEESIAGDLSPIKKLSPDAIVIDVHSASKAHLEICRLLKEDFITASIPIITLIDKRQLREQLLTLRQGVDDYLIKPPDPLDLRTRIEIAIKRSQYSFYSSPLTGLPGGRLVENLLKDKIESKQNFSFGHIDIDNFKSFNDVYGYIKGDRALMQTAYILYTVVRRFGNPEDFIGHIGGDDFVFITTPDRYKEICQYFIIMFDNIIPFHYNKKDREQGFIIARDRARKLKKIPMMSVTIAMINRRNAGEFNNIIEINEGVSEVKKYLKTIPGSKFMAERRNNSPLDAAEPQVYKKEEHIFGVYKPLGQILIEKNILTIDKLDEGLMMHWKRGVKLGEILKELGFIKQEDLQEALDMQKSVLTKT